MTTTEESIELQHAVELYVPTTCYCEQPLPEQARAAALEKVKKTFSEWFGAYSTFHGDGGWTMPNGQLVEEPIDIVHSQASAEAYQLHKDDVVELAGWLADELTQDMVATTFDGKMRLYSHREPFDRDGRCAHVKAGERGAQKLAKPRAGATEERAKMAQINVLLNRFSSRRDALDLFCGALEYTHTPREYFPTVGWPERLTGLLAGDPEVISNTNGFRILLIALAGQGLRRGHQRQVVTRVLKDDPTFRGLFIFRDESGATWELANAKVTSATAQGLILRRMRVGDGSGVRTATEQLAKVDLTGRPGLDAAAIQALHDEAFDVEKVTKKFYRDYAAVFEQAKAQLPAALNAEEKHLYAQSLFNRLMFLRFIERKGWLKLGDSPDYLQSLHEAGGIGRKSLYRSRIRPLFFEGLAMQDHPHSDAIGDVPFLNGGLFEKTPLDTKVKDLPDALFDPLIGANGLFYRYNFTVHESTPLDVEVAVDPEMLGKVFEELVTGRHESGSYYTPRPIVSFMCREALKGYLAGHVDCDPAQIAALVDDHDVQGLTPIQASRIIEALDDVKAVDPACGSGAYLLGLLQELLELYRLLLSADLVKDQRSLYDLKLHIISHNLYGVDLDRFAVNIAMLRLWLSLVVEYEGNEPPPLPNLDFKIECGDSLTGPDPGIEAIDMGENPLLENQLRHWARGLASMKDQFLKASGQMKEDLRKSIAKQERRIAEMLEAGERIAEARATNWWVQFTEVFGRDDGGFDIVLANPPYVRQELIKDQKPALKAAYGALFNSTADLYVYFYLRGLQLLRDGGMLAFISSNKWFRAGYGEKLRAHIAETCRIHSVTDFNDLPVFEDATAYAMIFVARKRPEPAEFTLTSVESLGPPYPDVRAVVRQSGDSLPASALAGSSWRLTTAAVADRMARMEKIGVPLHEFVGDAIYYGIKTGFNKAFVIDGKTRQALIDADPKSAEIIKPFAVGKDVRKWAINRRDTWLIFTRRGIDIDEYPTIKAHLSQWRDDLTPKVTGKEKRGRKPGPYQWYEIQDSIAYYAEFEKPKIVFPDISAKCRFAVDETGSYYGNTAYIMPPADLFLLCVLNSGLVNEWYVETSSQVRGGYLRFIYQYVSQIPIPDASEADRAALSALAQKCIEARGEGCEAWERESDERVEALYGL